ncbi:MAG: hypothetical protein M3021_09750, partial [Actinomycetota bacterium]|nr:hypothetical protein [Actinomycetota bacterium]
ISSLLPSLTPDAFWLAGHEPSCRFFSNEECSNVYAAYQHERMWRRFASPKLYLQRFRMLVGLQSSPTSQTAGAAYKRGLFERPPPPALIGRLVDFHVAHSPQEAAAGRGLDFAALATGFTGTWHLEWVRSYAFMGPYYEGNLPGKWAELAGRLRARYPDDGSNFCTLWSRVS